MKLKNRMMPPKLHPLIVVAVVVVTAWCFALAPTACEASLFSSTKRPSHTTISLNPSFHCRSRRNRPGNTSTKNRLLHKKYGLLASSKPTTTVASCSNASFHGDKDKDHNNDNDNILACDSHTDHNDFAGEEEWKALFLPENQDHCNSVERTIPTSIPRKRFRPLDQDTRRGFKQSLSLPAFLRTDNNAKLERQYPGKEKDPLMHSEEHALHDGILPVANKRQAVFTPKLNFRKNAQLPQSTTTTTASSMTTPTSSTGTALSAASKGLRPLLLWENMVCGAISRSIAQTIMHPANTMKTLLQQSNAPPLLSLMTPKQFPILFRGAGANFVLSVPHGAVNFAVLEKVRKEMSRAVQSSPYWREREERLGPALDFFSSAVSTICCSVVSTPQMMITDNIMAGNYNNLVDAVKGLSSQGNGIQGFYARGWWPGLVGKIPSYALTWTFFQQLKLAQKRFSGREATNVENSVMGCLASTTTVCIMIPMDTIKTRLVTQGSSAAVLGGAVPYKGIIDCAVRVTREEGIKTFYRGLPPRLISVVPMIGIQFTAYEFMKRTMQKRSLAARIEKGKQRELLQRKSPTSTATKSSVNIFGKTKGHEEFDPYSRLGSLQEASMEVAASPEHPYPAPHFLRRIGGKNIQKKKRPTK